MGVWMEVVVSDLSTRDEQMSRETSQHIMENCECLNWLHLISD